ncbi:hypothetical protein [Terriglobus tenax]|uniref:hypothetical protein n=1 Tax=Terriglobus tenax TaxID=1111115 RepID=UPI0021E0627B|nr:hypothetical protein [Terriglobus tenax]
MRTSECTDQVVGDILSGWRYDISGLTPEMRVDYERHLASCEHCRSRQQLHRTIDVSLIVVSTLSVLAFVVAVGILHRYAGLSQVALAHLHLRRVEWALTMKDAAVAGLLFSTIAWVLVAIATPAPKVLNGMLQDRMSEEARERFKRA